MERIDRIMKHPLFQQCREVIDIAERNRVYCRHNLEHSLDVARIAYILNLEEGGKLDQALIYAMALTHDLGRSEEYTLGKNHHVAGAELAELILTACGFSEEDTQMICQAIAAHKALDATSEPETGKEEQNWKKDYCRKLLYRADKLSRNCYDCAAAKTCYWDDNIRNHRIVY